MKGLNGDGKEELLTPAGLWVVDVPTGLSVPEAVPLYEASPDVESAGPDSVMVAEQDCTGSGASLDATLSDTPDPISVGGTLTYKATITNRGPEAAKNVGLTTVIPRGTEYVSSRVFNGDAEVACPPGTDRVIRCQVGDLGVDKAATLELAVRPKEPGLLSAAVDVGADNALLGTETTASATTDVLEAPSPPGPPPVDPPLPPAPPSGSTCTIWGTAGADRLVGTAGRDVLCGRGGDDTIQGMDGDDVLYGGPGRDRAIGGAGKDRLYGGDGADTLRVRDYVKGNDFARGGVGRDTVSADPRDDVRD